MHKNDEKLQVINHANTIHDHRHNMYVHESFNALNALSVPPLLSVPRLQLALVH